MNTRERCVAAYARLKNLKLVAAEVGVSWQTVYVHLRSRGVAVTGDKARYGSETDRLAARAEAEFQRLVPFANDQNKVAFQPKIDFVVLGYGVDVKCANKLRGSWMFSVKKQEFCADFIVCFCIDGEGYRTLLLPGEIVRRYQTVRVTPGGKWIVYECAAADLASFFRSLPAKVAA